MSIDSTKLSYLSGSNTPPAEIGRTPGIPLDRSVPKPQIVGAALVLVFSGFMGCTVAAWVFGSGVLTAFSATYALLGGLRGFNKVSPRYFLRRRGLVDVGTTAFALMFAITLLPSFPAALTCFFIACLTCTIFTSTVLPRRC